MRTLIFIAIAASALLEQQPRDNRARTPEGTAVLAGRVVTRDADTRPLRKTIVTLRSDDGRLHRTAITDDGGAFAFGGLPAGRYGLVASRRGWPAVAYGAARPHQRGTRIVVGDGERVEDLVIRMPRGAVLAGSLVDHTGRPMAHAAVVALRFMYLNGGRRLTRDREDYADERGIYRIYGLAAGEYLVATAGVPMAFEDLETIHTASEVDVRRAITGARGPSGRTGTDAFLPAPTVGYAPVYYPGTPVRAQAMPIAVAAGEERQALDFEVAPAPALSVMGIVSRPRTAPRAVNAKVTLRASGDEAAVGYLRDERQTSAGPDGAFVFGSVPPGTYDLLATLEVNDRITYWASSALMVAGDHAPRTILSLRPALTFAGRVAFDGEPAPDASGIRIALESLPAGDTFVASVDQAGAFVIDGLVPGRYRVLASVGGSRTRTWSVKSFVVNGAETLEAVMDLRSSGAGALITFTDRYGAVSGTVRNNAGRAEPGPFVVLFPTDPRQWGPFSRRIHAVRPSSDGSYLVEHLPPGEYFLALAADVEEGEWQDRAFLQRLAGSALKIDVNEGQRLVRDLRTE